MKTICKHSARLMVFVAMVFFQVIAFAQSDDNVDKGESLSVIARPSADSVTLRWAPKDIQTWEEGNRYGYVIERYLLARNNTMVSPPEKTILTPTPVKRLEDPSWEPLVKVNNYAAIAAQAIFGERFTVDMGQQDVFSIVNQAREEEQRFTFALFCADMSPAVAIASGLWFTDHQVVKGQRYLYRVMVNKPESQQRPMGSVFLNTDDEYELPVPSGITGDFNESTVMLKWDKAIMGKYTAYVIERSADGKKFERISDIPVVSVAPLGGKENRYEYASDSLPVIGQTYHYRVKGITPFGETGPASETVSGSGAVELSVGPNIFEGVNLDNRSVSIKWEFEEKNNKELAGFTVERATFPKGQYKVLTGSRPLPVEVREFVDNQPEITNYYRVLAVSKGGKEYRSPLYYVQLVDSVPPVAPRGLKAVVSDSGVVTLSWDPNQESDIYGYRVYKANYETEEFSESTNEPVLQIAFHEKVNLNTLSENLYYKVMAIDNSQNHSSLSEVLMVALPDKVKPEPPVFMPVQSDEEGLKLSWQASASRDVVSYEVLRKDRGGNEWEQVDVIDASEAVNPFEYIDEKAGSGRTYVYTLLAIDEAGLKSDSAQFVQGAWVNNRLQAPVKWRSPEIEAEKKEVNLSWKYERADVSRFLLYKSTGENPPVLYKTLQGNLRNFTDSIIIGGQVTYRILVVFEDGGKSRISEGLLVKF
ncbi:MAG: hypothetical protein OEW75_00930 [Cyclobacteriaceae bacterium]|nr:hypothetical protein [Cyclobacteriaceae bacterium]